MAYATVAEVLLEAGLDHPSNFQLFRFSSEAELHAFTERKIAAAAGWLRRKITAAVYDTSAVADPDLRQSITQAEIWRTCILLVKPLEARKTMGTHWAVDSQEAESYGFLIEQWERLLTDFLLELEEEAEGDVRPYALPAIAITTGVDRTLVPVWPDLLQDDLDIANGLIGEEALS